MTAPAYEPVTWGHHRRPNRRPVERAPDQPRRQHPLLPVPAPTGGTFLVEVALRRRWCSLTVDRWVDQELTWG